MEPVPELVSDEVPFGAKAYIPKTEIPRRSIGWQEGKPMKEQDKLLNFLPRRVTEDKAPRQ